MLRVLGSNREFFGFFFTDVKPKSKRSSGSDAQTESRRSSRSTKGKSGNYELAIVGLNNANRNK